MAKNRKRCNKRKRLILESRYWIDKKVTCLNGKKWLLLCDFSTLFSFYNHTCTICLVLSNCIDMTASFKYERKIGYVQFAYIPRNIASPQKNDLKA